MTRLGLAGEEGVEDKRIPSEVHISFRTAAADRPACGKSYQTLLDPSSLNVLFKGAVCLATKISSFAEGLLT